MWGSIMKKLVPVRILVACLVALLAVSCGGESGGEDTTTTQATEVETTTTTAAPEESEDDTGDVGSLGDLSTVCLEATTAMAEAASSYSTGLAEAFSGTLDDEALQVAADQLQAMADAAPDEIRDDFRIIADALAAFYTAFGEIDYQAGATPTPEQAEQLAALAETFDNDAFDQASQNIEAWFEGNCQS
jgi:hypothetical protein